MSTWLAEVKRPKGSNCQCTHLNICCCLQILNKIRGDSSLMASSLIVKIKHMRLRIFVGFIFNKRFNRLHVWKCLHSEFAVESTSKLVVNLIFLLCPVPDYYVS